MRFRGDKKKCLMAIADFVLLYDKAAEALAKRNRVGFDFYTGIADTKAQWIKWLIQKQNAKSHLPL